MTTFDHLSDTTATRDRTTGSGHGSSDAAPNGAAGAPDRTTRWGPAWVGAVVALPVFVVLQLLFISLGWIALGVDGPGAGVAASVVSAVLAIVALFVGGLACGTASSWRGVSANTALQGAMTWALTSVALLMFGLVGGGALAGTLGGLSQLVVATGPTQFGGNPAVVAQAVQAIQNGAGWAALWLGVAFVAAVLGTGVGAGATKGVGSKGVGAPSRRDHGTEGATRR